MWTFNPIFKTIIWGGEKIAPFKGIKTEQTSIGESWEISGVEGSESVVADGADAGLTLTQLLERYGAKLLGEKNYRKYGNTFPLLIKFIDACQDLSVQGTPQMNLQGKEELNSARPRCGMSLEPRTELVLQMASTVR